jgi:hypothetical protein
MVRKRLFKRESRLHKKYDRSIRANNDQTDIADPWEGDKDFPASGCVGSAQGGYLGSLAGKLFRAQGLRAQRA